MTKDWPILKHAIRLTLLFITICPAVEAQQFCSFPLILTNEVNTTQQCVMLSQTVTLTVGRNFSYTCRFIGPGGSPVLDYDSGVIGASGDTVCNSFVACEPQFQELGATLSGGSHITTVRVTSPSAVGIGPLVFCSFSSTKDFHGTCATQSCSAFQGGEGGDCLSLQLDCVEQGGQWDEENCECNNTPIIVSRHGNKLRLTSASNGVLFDLDTDGSAERIAWTAAGADDAFLVLDRNGNGMIDDGSELFGNFTPQPSSPDPNGFLALAMYDDSSNGGNEDGRISVQDSVFSGLHLWVDSNHDGISQAEELRSAAASGITEFELDYHESRRKDRHGNEFRYTGIVRMGKFYVPRVRFAVDVFLLSHHP